jgi:hypothetical protein
MALSLNPTKMHPPTLLGCVVILVVVILIYHFTLGHKKAG